jgi:hypothetical protein
VRHRNKRHRIRSSCSRKKNPAYLKMVRGNNGEALVGNALRFLKKEGCIQDFKMSARNDEFDRQGIDARFWLLDGTLVSLQVKTTSTDMYRHAKRYPQIPAINVRACKLPSEVAVILQAKFRLPSFLDDEQAPT